MLIPSVVIQTGLGDALPPDQADGKRCPFLALKRERVLPSITWQLYKPEKPRGESVRSTLVTASLS